VRGSEMAVRVLRTMQAAAAYMRQWHVEIAVRGGEIAVRAREVAVCGVEMAVRLTHAVLRTMQPRSNTFLGSITYTHRQPATLRFRQR
jgi:hypothetical protein